MVLRNQTAEDASPLISWIPAEQWIDGGAADTERPNYSADSFRLTTSKGAYASFGFNGTGVWIYGAKRFNHGPYQGTIDGVTSPQQDGFSVNDQLQQLLYSATNLPMGHHVVTIANEWVDVNAPYLDVDFIVWETDVSDEATKPDYILDDGDASIQYNPGGDWKQNQCITMGSYYGNTCHITSAPSSTAQIEFSGDAVAIYGGVGPAYGPYTVTLDQGPTQQYTANSTSHHTQVLLYYASGLGLGNHTATLANMPSTLSSVLDIDYIQVIGGTDPQNIQGGSGSKSNNHIGTIVGAILGVLVVIALGIIGFLLWRRRQRRKPGRRSSSFDVDANNAVPRPYPLDPHSDSPADTESTPWSQSAREATSQVPLMSAIFPNQSINDVGNNTQSSSRPFSQETSRTGSATNQQHPSSQGTLTYTSPDSSSASACGAPISAVGGKTDIAPAPTIRNEATNMPGVTQPFRDPPPSYTVP